MPRYKLRTLLIMLAVLPPVFGGAWWAYEYRVRRVREEREAWEQSWREAEVAYWEHTAKIAAELPERMARQAELEARGDAAGSESAAWDVLKSKRAAARLGIKAPP